ncbi:rCG46369 [Rattus norvegicus]|uniref:RCG46369 n=1 Tax=Rattus norvegicus TaxID=10116 RepID=A6ICX4_RAT|nr:rCG46369 [Rattus norvegicus]
MGAVLIAQLNLCSVFLLDLPRSLKNWGRETFHGAKLQGPFSMQVYHVL